MSYAITRETYFAALFALFGPLKPGTVKTCSRTLRLMEEMGDGELPALFMSVTGKDKTVQKYKQEPERTLQATVYLYCANPQGGAAAGPLLNALIDAVEAAIAPAPAYSVQTLGGLVHQCAIVGETEKFENFDSTRAAAIVPVEMVVP